MTLPGRIMAVLAACFFVAAVVAAWLASAAGGEIWYVPLVCALAAAVMTVGTLRQRKSRASKKE